MDEPCCLLANIPSRVSCVSMDWLNAGIEVFAIFNASVRPSIEKPVLLNTVENISDTF